MFSSCNSRYFLYLCFFLFLALSFTACNKNDNGVAPTIFTDTVLTNAQLLPSVIAPTIVPLEMDLSAYITHEGTLNSLQKKLDKVVENYTQGDYKKASNSLKAFKNQLDAQAGNHVSLEAYQVINSHVEAIKNSIEVTNITLSPSVIIVDTDANFDLGSIAILGDSTIPVTAGVIWSGSGVTGFNFKAPSVPGMVSLICVVANKTAELNVNIIPAVPPKVINVTSDKANGPWNYGAEIKIQVQFDKIVKVNGAPKLSLATRLSLLPFWDKPNLPKVFVPGAYYSFDGNIASYAFYFDSDPASNAFAEYETGDNSDILIFIYKVRKSLDTTPSLNYLSKDALTLNGGTIKDSAGRDANLTLPAPGGTGSLSVNKNLLIDTIAPGGVNFFKAIDVNTTKIKLEWSYAFDNIYPSHTIVWKVVYSQNDNIGSRTNEMTADEIANAVADANANGVPVNNTWQLSQLTNEIEVTGLQPDTQYYFNVLTNDQGGNTGISQRIAVKTLPDQPKIVSIAKGDEYSMALKSDGTVWAWGRNSHGQLGDNTTIYRYTPIQVNDLTGVTAIAAGGEHSLALKSDGTVWEWGNNYDGRGNTTIDIYTPIQISGLTGVTAISAGQFFSIVLKSDGTVWAWGFNYYGQLGDNTTIDRHTPIQVSDLTGVTAISAGGGHSLALKSDGTVWVWGSNYSGGLGDNTTIDRYTPIQVSGLTGVNKIAAGSSYSLVLKLDGTMWAWGSNYSGQLGDNTTIDRYMPIQVSGLTGVNKIAAGSSYSLVLKSDGTVWAWGRNFHEQISTPVQVFGLSNITTICCGQRHAAALKSDDTVWAWGYNYHGELGDGTTTDSSIPVKVLFP